MKAVELCEFDSKTYLITLSDARQKNSMQIANELHEHGLFEYVAPEMVIFVERFTTDTHYQQQWALHNNTSGIRAPQAWAITMGSPNIRIAILDSGVDIGHPDLLQKSNNFFHLTKMYYL